MQDISKASSFCKLHVISTASHSSLQAGLIPWAYTYSYLLTWLSHTLDGKVTKVETISYSSLILSLALDTMLVSQQAFNKYLLKQIDWLIYTNQILTATHKNLNLKNLIRIFFTVTAQWQSGIKMSACYITNIKYSGQKYLPL